WAWAWCSLPAAVAGPDGVRVASRVFLPSAGFCSSSSSSSRRIRHGLLGDLPAGPGLPVIRGGPMPGGGTGGVVYLGVLYALGGAMVFWAFMRRAPWWLIAALSAAAVAATQVAMPGPDRTSVLY